MSATVLDGSAIAAEIKSRIRKTVQERIDDRRRAPGLAVVLVGEEPSSTLYVRLKQRDCEEVGYKSVVIRLPVETPQKRVLTVLDELNEDPTIDGILVQLPLPTHLDSGEVIEHIAPHKDVDGLHPYNMGRLAARKPVLRSCTPKGIMTLLRHTGVELRGLDATIIGASNDVGRPMTLELLLAGCTVTTAHKFTRDTRMHVEYADVVVSATGKPGLVKGDWIREGAIVIDVGITQQPDGRLLGDVEFEAAAERAAWITPVPGGVGPMTRASMLENTLFAAEVLHT
jgi:methylenetetrahydrofolate dehydrogenase (NADP+)/methenyltetrahydrofolate cyclohydrolase